MAPKSKKAKTEEEPKKEEEPTEAKKEEPTETKEEKEDAEVKTEEAKAEDSKDDIKQEGDVKMETEEVQKPPEKKEEADAPEDKRAKVKADQVCFSMPDATCNVMPTANGRLLLPLCSGGMQYLFAGVRCTAGVKSGRYFFETKIVEMLNPSEGGQSNGPRPRQLVRVGVTLATNSPLLDESAGNVYFDSEGSYFDGQRRNRTGSRFSKDQVIGVLLNVDAESPNANTISLFRDGYRVSDPQPLPEGLAGKVVYPCITFKNVGLEVNFGPTPKKPLPFTCRMLKDAAAADLELPAAAKDGKREVIFPVGLPDQGVFEWLDGYVEKNPHYVELSDRKILEWAEKSQLQRQRGYATKFSNDKPGMNFNIPLMDDNSVQKTLTAVVPALKKDFVHMELKSNLISAERIEALKTFPSSDFKRVAVIAMGEPSAEIKAKAQELALAEKIRVAKREKERAAREKERAERDEKEKAAREKAQAAREESRKRKLEEEEKKDEEKKADPDDAETKAEDGDKSEEPEKKEAADEEKKEEEKEEQKMEVEEEEKPIELTEEEKKDSWFIKSHTPDMSKQVLAKAFASFSLPTKEEGFDEIRYAWQKEDVSCAHLKAWILQIKKTSRAEDLEPSDWFKEKLAAWTKAKDDWRKRHSEAANAPKKDNKAAPEKKVEKEDKPEEEKKEGEEEKKEGEEEEKKEGEEEEADAAMPDAAAAEEDEDEEPDVDKVEDINDMRRGKPLYADFAYEDWALLCLRFELHLLVHAFKKDLNDEDRPGFAEKDLSFYFNKYYKKSFNVTFFNAENLAGVCELVKDTLSIDPETGFLESLLPADVADDKFVRLTEEGRRERQRCIDAGDETANLKFKRENIGGSKGSSKGGDRHDDRRGDRGGDRGPDRGGDRGGDRRVDPRGPAVGLGDRRGGDSRGPAVGYGDRGADSRGAAVGYGDRGGGAPPMRGGYGGGDDRRGGGGCKGPDQGKGGYGKRGTMPAAGAQPGYGPSSGPPRGYGGNPYAAYGAPPPPSYGGGPYGAPPGGGYGGRR